MTYQNPDRQPAYQQSGQQQWPSYQRPQPGPGQPPPGHRQPPQGPWFRRHPVWSWIIVVFAVLLVIGGIENAVHGRNKQHVAATALSSATASLSATAQAAPKAVRSPAAVSVARTKPKTKVKSKPAGSKIVTEADACDNRPDASGDIYVWMLTPGVQAEAQQLGGEWRWDYASNKCLTSVQRI